MDVIKGRLIGTPNSDKTPQPAAVAIGNFDGVHRGHQAVIQAMQQEAQGRNLLATILTFEPHPRQFFAPNAPAFHMTQMPLKLRRLASLGLDQAYIADFSAELSSLSAEDFAKYVLSERLNARHVVVGENFRFGHKRAGDITLLHKLGKIYGFTVQALASAGEQENIFSSSAARAALRAGQPQEAARILGTWHRIEGRVEQGDQRGRDLGFPTANLALENILVPAFGVYAVLAEIRHGDYAGCYPGVASLGVRPQFGGEKPNFETHLFDFSGDIYGEELSVALLSFLRPETTFNNVEALIAQMHQDSHKARQDITRLRASG